MRVTLDTNALNAEMQALIKSLDAMDDEVNDAIVEAMREGGEIIAQEQRRLAPVGKEGRLAQAIDASQVVRTKKGNLQTKVGYDFKKHPEAKHGIYQEFGRKGGTNKSGKKISKMEAQPHIRPGFEAKKETAYELIIAKLKEVLKW